MGGLLGQNWSGHDFEDDRRLLQGIRLHLCPADMLRRRLGHVESLVWVWWGSVQLLSAEGRELLPCVSQTVLQDVQRQMKMNDSSHHRALLPCIYSFQQTKKQSKRKK